jgi:cytochrome c
MTGEPSQESPLRWVLVIVPVLLIAAGLTNLLGMWRAPFQEAQNEAPIRSTKSEPRTPDGDAAVKTPTVSDTFDAAIVVQMLAKADPQEGARAFRLCEVCHTSEKGGPHKVGPNLWGIVGAPKAAQPGFRYSQALKGTGGIWSYRELIEYNHNPRASVPGTSMAFAGITQHERMANLIAYLRTLSDNPARLPN